MKLLAHHSLSGRAISRTAHTWLEGCFRGDPLDSWNGGTREAFFDLLAGPYATVALELLDHIGAWRVLMPEWLRIRSLAQHDPYHRYTVDGHLFIAVTEVQRAIADDALAHIAAQEAGDLRSLRLGALLHDVGKGSGRDHSVAGEELAHAICARIGLDATQTAEVAALVRHHLLLVDTATRRDLDDGAVIAEIAEKIGDGRLLRLLYVLSIADGHATGPEGWSEWKGALMRDLYRKVLVALETGEVPTRSDVLDRAREVEAYEPGLAGRAQELLQTLPPSYLESTAVEDMADELRLLLQPPQRGQVRYRIYEGSHESAIAVCVPDRPGTLARTAGVLTLNRISVLRAQAFSTTSGLALERFTVRSPEPKAFERFAEDLQAVYSGRLALEARLDSKIADYSLGTKIEADVRVLQDASQHSTVVEVRAPDALGLLYAITAALSELDLDIHVAKIDTLGERVVDAFYVRTAGDDKLSDEQVTEVERSIVHRIDRLFNR
jgi:[protein-PII] uridylyltransferase